MNISGQTNFTLAATTVSFIHLFDAFRRNDKTERGIVNTRFGFSYGKPPIFDLPGGEVCPVMLKNERRH